jgi:peptidoglycan/LPS O-acetylase OafA/YrhL
MSEAVTTRRKLQLDSIEVCRGIAATMVVTYHASRILSAKADFGEPPFDTFFQFGRSGVDFFFVLSGFLISLLHWRDIGTPARLKHYGVRRVTRIYPTYWLVLVAIVPFDLFTHTLFDDYNKPFEVVKSILLLPQQVGILDVTWSLRNELMFYALFGLMIFNRRAGWIVVSVWIAAMAVWPFAFAMPENSWLHVLLFPMNFEFLAGVAAGWAVHRVTIARPLTLVCAGLAVFVVLWTLEDQLRLMHLPWDRFLYECLAYGVAATAVIVGLSALEMQGRLKMPRPLIVLGGASYLLYLVHVPALLVLGASERHLHLLRFMPPWVLDLAFIVGIVAVTIVVHLKVEKPLLRAIRRSPPPPKSGIVGLDEAVPPPVVAHS